MRYYLIRHKASDEYMPQMKRDRGYTNWNPSNSANPLVAALPVPRLIDTRRRAARIINMWASLPNGHMGFSRGDYFGMDEPEVVISDDKRKKEDLEIVEVDIVEVKE